MCACVSVRGKTSHTQLDNPRASHRQHFVRIRTTVEPLCKHFQANICIIHFWWWLISCMNDSQIYSRTSIMSARIQNSRAANMVEELSP